jgi:O-antigen/teichoic acid export membrane protein
MPTVIAALCGVAVALLMPHLLAGWLSDYQEYAIVFYVMIAGILPVVMNEAVGAVVLAEGNIRSWVLSDVMLALSMALVYWLTVPLVGALGFAIAHVVGYLTSTVVLLWVLSRRRKSAEPTLDSHGASSLGEGWRDGSRS